jgi:septum formation protein
MSLSTLRRLVREVGVEWTELWNTVDPSLGASEDEAPALS